MPTLLVIDDEPSILHAFRRAFREPEVTLLTASTATQGVELVTQRRPDAVILDIQLPDLSGLEVFRQIHQFDARIPITLMTGHGTADTAIEAMKLGAFDYLLKPLDLPELRKLVARALHLSRLMRVPAVMQEESAPESADVIIGRCPAMQEVYKMIGMVAPQDLTVLILGESGTGKELVARAIYQHSRRAAGPFLAINCAAIPETLLESELFGHEKGAFTGADRQRIGKFEQCNGGTLFLDEIGDMTPLTQAKILRVLQEQRFERVGGNQTITTDVRLLAATNRQLDQLVASEQFRTDLYYRLSVFGIALPPLRERGEDLPLLVEHFLKRFNRELGKEVYQVAPEALEVLQAYWWPGNLRELQSVLKQAILRAKGPILLPDFLPATLKEEEKSPEPAVTTGDSGLERLIEERLKADSSDLYAEALTLMERQLITRVLRHTGGNLLRAAKILGITRGSLRNKVRTLGIMIERSVWSEDDPPGNADLG
jgi:two-component system nitrogen regulation response regulator GlnG